MVPEVFEVRDLLTKPGQRLNLDDYSWIWYAETPCHACGSHLRFERLGWGYRCHECNEDQPEGR